MIFTTVLPKLTNFNVPEAEWWEVCESVRNSVKFWNSWFLVASRNERLMLLVYGRNQQQAKN